LIILTDKNGRGLNYNFKWMYKQLNFVKSLTKGKDASISGDFSFLSAGCFVPWYFYVFLLKE
jgi:hypothetical protein